MFSPAAFSGKIMQKTVIESIGLYFINCCLLSCLSCLLRLRGLIPQASGSLFRMILPPNLSCLRQANKNSSRAERVFQYFLINCWHPDKALSSLWWMVIIVTGVLPCPAKQVRTVYNLLIAPFRSPFAISSWQSGNFIMGWCLCLIEGSVVSSLLS